MKKSGIIFLTTMILAGLSLPSSAQIDPGPDGIGVYFDTEASIVSATAGVGDVLQAYLIGTGLTGEGNIGYWQAKVCPQAGPIDITGSPYGGFNYNMNMPGDGCWGCVTFGFETPIPTQEITLLASLTIQIWGDWPAEIHMEWDGGYYQIFGSEDVFPFYPSSGSLDLPVATVNGEAPVATESHSWDALKTLYR